MIAKSGVCSVAWISQRLPEPLTRVQIPADPLSLLEENSGNRGEIPILLFFSLKTTYFLSPPFCGFIAFAIQSTGAWL